MLLYKYRFKGKYKIQIQIINFEIMPVLRSTSKQHIKQIKNNNQKQQQIQQNPQSPKNQASSLSQPQGTIQQKQQLNQYKQQINLVIQKCLSPQSSKQEIYLNENRFITLLQQCKEKYGEQHLFTANLYFQYASLLMNILQKQIQFFYIQLIKTKKVEELIQLYQNENKQPFLQISNNKKKYINLHEDEIQIRQYYKQSDNENEFLFDFDFSNKNSQDQNQSKADENEDEKQSKEEALIYSRQQEQYKQNIQQKKQTTPQNDVVHPVKQDIQTKIQKNTQLTQQQKDKLLQQQQYQEQLIETILQHLQKSLQIYQTTIKKINQSNAQKQLKIQIQTNIIMIYSRLGDLFMMDQCYPQAVIEYKVASKLIQQLVKQLKSIKQSHTITNSYQRRLSEIYYMIGTCLVSDNQEQSAINHFIQTLTILKQSLQSEANQKISLIELPSWPNIKIDRTNYLNSASDSQIIKDIKSIMSQIIDRIDDTYEIYLKKKENLRNQRELTQNQSEITQNQSEITQNQRELTQNQRESTQNSELQHKLQRTGNKRRRQQILLSSVKKQLLHQSTRKFQQTRQQKGNNNENQSLVNIANRCDSFQI